MAILTIGFVTGMNQAVKEVVAVIESASRYVNYKLQYSTPLTVNPFAHNVTTSLTDMNYYFRFDCPGAAF